MIRYYARLNPTKIEDSFLNREEVMRVSDAGAQFGFGLSVLDERGLLRPDPSALEPERPLPLLTWPFLDFLDSLELADCSLLELGAGNSTLWFARRMRKVRSFETDPKFYEALSPQLSPNVELRWIELDALERGQVGYEDETFVLVDFAGRRTRFLREFLTRLTERRPAAIVLDNADWYRNGAAVLAEHGYRELPFHGFKSGQSFISCTSLFLRDAAALPPAKRPFHRPAFARRFENAWDAP
jgi:hypothetical protein